MASIRPNMDHHRRILEHQERIAVEQRTPEAPLSDSQLRIPLIGEVRRPEPPLKRKRSKTKKPVQPQLGGV